MSSRRVEARWIDIGFVVTEEEPMFALRDGARAVLSGFPSSQKI